MLWLASFVFYCFVEVLSALNFYTVIGKDNIRSFIFHEKINIVLFLISLFQGLDPNSRRTTIGVGHVLETVENSIL